MGRYKFEETLRLEGQLLKVLSHSRATYDLNSSIHILLILICASSLVTPPSFLKKTSSSTLLIVTRMLARSIITSILFASSGFGQMSMSSGAVDPSMTMASTVDPSMTMASTMDPSMTMASTVDPSMTMDSVTGSMMSSATSSIAPALRHRRIPHLVTPILRNISLSLAGFPWLLLGYQAWACSKIIV